LRLISTRLRLPMEIQVVQSNLRDDIVQPNLEEGDVHEVFVENNETKED